MSNDLIIDYSRSKPVKLTPVFDDPDFRSRSVFDLEFSVRTGNVLRKAGIETVGEFYDYGLGNIKNLKGLGTKGYKELIEVMYVAVSVDDKHPFKFHVGASRVLTVALEASREGDGRSVLQMIWPHMSDELADMVLKFPKECKIDGASLSVPESWGTVIEIGKKGEDSVQG